MTPPLLRRFPRLRGAAASHPVIPPDKWAAYPALETDLEFLERELAPVFQEHDLAALADQNRYRRQQVLILVGSALAGGLAGLQVMFPSQRWPGLVIAVLGAVLASSTVWAHEARSRASYQEHRVKAERLRGLYFQYLGRVADYAGPDRDHALREAVIEIAKGRDPE
jgi:hypothetical protein